MTSLCKVFPCTNCGASNSQVTDSRQHPEEAFILRRRKCLHCGERFSTWEVTTDPATVEPSLWRHRYERLRAAINVLMEPL